MGMMIFYLLPMKIKENEMNDLVNLSLALVSSIILCFFAFFCGIIMGIYPKNSDSNKEK